MFIVVSLLIAKDEAWTVVVAGHEWSWRQFSMATYKIQLPLIFHDKIWYLPDNQEFPDKFILNESVESELKKVLIPPFTLQPLVENSIRHAFSKGTVGTITICAYKDNDKMVLITEDDGKGMSEDTLYMIGQKNITSSTGTGTALWNIQERVKKIYGDKGRFTIESEWNRGTKVMITLPSKEPTIWRGVDD